MRAQVFPLAAVKEWRENQKSLAEQALAAELRRELEAEQRLRSARDAMAAMAAAAGAGTRWTAGDRARSFGALQLEELRCKQLAEVAAAAARQAQQQRDAAEEARRSFELVAKLEEKWRAGQRRAAARREQNQLDEIAQIRTHRQWEDPS